MLIEAAPAVRTVKVSAGYTPPQTGYPHYRLIPVQTEAGRFYCLLFYITDKDFLILEPKIKRHPAVRKPAGFLKTATYPVYETVYGASP
ncbi:MULTISPECIES: lipopolysaccharide heptosyltransferase [unclassified Neisseria]|uniref:lipopolysaccharide heptosyltransferase n=1 Tax=unclassified Neisseria TaxID=2623750 RepID=UPI00107163DE|nr:MULTISPECIES: lipopolysaccharide heptosyltransferase [unclassified Neisseria]MBF0805075.1 lipopolysaccharide heptosyltransferase [Neisseria sp. 19428wB4_WF04]TFU38073.1 lipopolysaccharide heptosyltransferase [Neisseria sp. WF04]